MIKKGDRIVVSNLPNKVIVEDVIYEKQTDRIIMILDWGQFGKSKVYYHDENKTWHRYLSLN